MIFRSTLITVLLLTTCFAAKSVPDHKPVSKTKKVHKKEVTTALKESVQFNYGVPLKDETITAPKKITLPSEEGVSYYNWIQKKYAEKMNTHPASITNEALYKFIDEWYGTRYVYGGTTKHGIDCSSFVQKLMDAISGIEMQRTAASQYTTAAKVERNELQEGDLVFFKIKVHHISHVGVYLQNNHFVHASSSRGVMISDLNSEYWSRYYAGGGRVSM